MPVKSLWMILLPGLCLGLSLGPAAAGQQEEPLVFRSPVAQVKVLELFTSHGCNSCPPADAWLRGLGEREDLWTGVVPLAFHVDYWNWLGWDDRFARASYSQRQRDYRRSGGIRSVYTPGFVISGREWRGWFRGQAPDLRPGDPVGQLILEASPGDSLAVRFEAVDGFRADGPLQAHAALLGFGLSSAIGAGENAGRTLREDFVVLGTSHGTEASATHWSLAWPRVVSAAPERMAIVAWISKPGDPAPLQAVGGWLP